MPSGLQVFAADGSVILDTNDKMTFILGSFTTEKGNNGAVAVASGRDRWAQVMGVGGYFGSSGAPQVWFEGDTLRWSWDYANANRAYQVVRAIIVFGYY